jgi:tight adherence protein C
MTLIVPLLAFITTGLLVMALVPPRAASLRQRLAPYGAGVIPARERLLGDSFGDRVMRPAVGGIARLAMMIAPANIMAKAELELAQADNPMTVEQYMAMRLVAMVGAPLAYVFFVVRGQSLSPFQMTFVVVLFVAGGRFSSWWVRRSIKKRQDQIERSLPSALDLIVVCMEAGLSFDSGLAKVVEKTKGALADECERVLQEMQMGKQRRDALRDMAKRAGVRDMSALVAAIVQADQMGMSLAPVLRAQADDLRTKRRQRAEEQAQKAAVKMLFPLILCILPSSMLVLLGPGIVIMATQLLSQISNWS